MTADSAERRDTIVLALSGPVDFSHAPVPTNSDERIAFRQLFQTLLRLDCQGEVRPGLATSWRSDSSGRTWTFTIRDDAHFADGTTLTAHSVQSDWRRRWSALQIAGLDSVQALDDRNLLVKMGVVRDSLPKVFGGELWSIVPSGSSSLRRTPLTTIPLSRMPVAEIVVPPGGDLRDALDAGADIVVSGDRQLIDYAVRQSGLQTFPLPWDRTYALLQRPGAEPIPALWDSTSRSSLARDAVQTDARPGQARYWWNYGPCAVEILMELTIPTAGRIVYQQTDPVARQLAERIVALAGTTSPLSAVGMDPDRFTSALTQGEDRGYIVAIPLHSASPCRESAEWTGRGHLYPLIDTRQQAIIRRGSPALTVDWDGTPRLPFDSDSKEESLR